MTRTRQALLAARLAVQPRWLAGLAVAAAFAVLCGLLGQWQWHRREAVEVRNALVAANYDAVPVPLGEVLRGPGGPQVPPAAEWRPVALRGVYDDGATVLVRNRPLDGRVGYLVTTPLRLDRPVAGGDSIWLVRGWLPAGEDADPSPPAAPSGEVAVTARLRRPEPVTDRRAPAGQAYRLSPAELGVAAGRAGAAPVGTPVSGFGLVTPAQDGLAAVGVPDPDPSPHLAYTVQWWLFAAAGFAIWVVFLWRTAGETSARPGPVAGRPRDREDRWRYEPGG